MLKKIHLLAWVLTISLTTGFIVKTIEKALKDIRGRILQKKILKLDIPTFNFTDLENAAEINLLPLNNTIESISGEYEKRKNLILELKSKARTLKTMPIQEKNRKIPKIKRSS